MTDIYYLYVFIHMTQLNYYYSSVLFCVSGLEISGSRPHALLQRRARQTVHLQKHRCWRDADRNLSGEPDLHLRSRRDPEDASASWPLQHSSQHIPDPVREAAEKNASIGTSSAVNREKQMSRCWTSFPRPTIDAEKHAGGLWTIDRCHSRRPTLRM